MEADFKGWATKAGVKCADGRTIMPDAFKAQDKAKVPLVWQHGHSDPENVLGHVLLENRREGVWAEGFFNKTKKAEHQKEAVSHGDITAMSIWANDLMQRSGRVIHGVIREVSLVLSGANPGALIESVTVRHSDGEEETLEDEALIFSGEEIQHGDDDPEGEGEDDDKKKDDDLKHGDGEDETIADIVETMSDKQRKALEFLLGEVADAATAEHSNVNKNGEDDKVSRNVFEKDEKKTEPVLSHSAVKEIVADATKGGSLKEAVEAYALAHGIENIDVLFPEATQLTSAPEFINRRMEWVNSVLQGVRKSPFSRVRTATADLTWEDARAKGYIKGNMKKEEFFSVARRETTPQTIYKKQKLDRDDILDITDFDVVTWMKGEMRIMLDEELARAILIGDGRDGDDEDKIREDRIRPIAYDDDFYAIKLNVDVSTSYRDLIRAVIRARSQYRGTGQPTLYTTESVIAEFLLLEDTMERRLYTSLDQVAAELRVDRIVPVEVLEDQPDGIVGIIVNLADYNVGADRGGQVSMFDDFDIDYNQYKYLIETRCSGALIRPKSAIVLTAVPDDTTLVTAPTPTFNATTGVVTIPASADVNYQLEDGTPLADGAQTALPPGGRMTVVAVPTAGNYLASSETFVWKFFRPVAP